MKIIAGQTPGWGSCEVYIDGKLSLDCVTADDENGVYEIYERDSNGALIFDADGTDLLKVRLKRLTSKVEIKFPHGKNCFCFSSLIHETKLEAPKPLIHE